MPDEKHEEIEGVLGEMLGVAQLIEEGNRAPILPEDLRMWAERIKAAIVRERAFHQTFMDGLKLACDHLREQRDRAVKYANAAPHPGSASWKEMQAAFAEAKKRIEDAEKRQPEENSGNVAELRKSADACRRGKSSQRGCEFYDKGLCRGIVFLTNPPQFDPCKFEDTTEEGGNHA